VWNEYAREKLLEIEADLERARAKRAQPPPDVKQRHLLAPVAGVVGRRLRRMGEAIESWASPGPEDCNEARRTA
jgi:multidrug resistance efflux pump